MFQAHGTHDPMVGLERGEALRDALQSRGHAVDFHAYPMQHQVCWEEIQEVSAFFQRVLGVAGDGGR